MCNSLTKIAIIIIIETTIFNLGVNFVPQSDLSENLKVQIKGGRHINNRTGTDRDTQCLHGFIRRYKVTQKEGQR